MFPVVEMDYGRREEGYAALGSYFDGSNDAGDKFAYSQPVVMEYHPDVSNTVVCVVMLVQYWCSCATAVVWKCVCDSA